MDLFQIIYYSTNIFSDAGIKNGDVATAVVGLILVLGTLAIVGTSVLACNFSLSLSYTHPHTDYTDRTCW